MHEISGLDAQRQFASQHLAALYKLTDRLYRAHTEQEVYDAALDVIMDALGCDRASILLFDEKGIIRFVAWRGLSDGYRTDLEGHSPWKPGDAAAEPIFVKHIDDTDESPRVKQRIKDESIIGLAFIPLFSSGCLVGKFMTYFPEAHEFLPSEIELAVAISRQLGFAIERLRAEEERRAAEGRLRWILEHAPVMIWTSNPQGHCEHLNKLLRDFWGVREQDISSFDFMKTVHPDDLDEVVRVMGDAIANRKSAHVRARYLNARGEYRLLETDARPRVTPWGEFEGMIGANLDITERHLTQEALQDSEERLRLAASTARIGTWDLDLATGIGRWDETAVQNFGLSPEQATENFTRQRWSDLIHPDDRDRVRADFSASLSSEGPPFNVEFKGAIPSADGGVRWLGSHGAVFLDPVTGRVRRAVGILRDITAEKRAQITLSESEARFRTLVSTIPSFVWFADGEGKVLYINDRWHQFTGQTPETSMPDGWIDAVHPDDVERVTSIAAEAHGKAQPYEMECRYRKADGSFRWYVTRAEPQLDSEGRVQQWFGTCTDIHDRKEWAERIEMALDAGAIMGTWLWDVVADSLTADERFARAFGLDPEVCRVGARLSHALTSVHEDDRARVREEIDAAVRNKGGYRCEYRARNSEGEYRWVEAIGRVEFSSDGKVGRFPGLVIDIEARRSMEAERDRATSLLLAFVEAVPGAVYAKRRDGRVMICNRGFANSVGQDPDSCVGKTDVELRADKSQAEAVMESDAAVMQKGEVQQIEEQITLPDGRLSYWLSIKAPFRDRYGAVIGLVGASVDITERREAEERERLLAREVDHRSKNLLGVVRSVVQLTRASDIEGLKTSVSGRIQSLARVHSLLAAGRWEGVNMDQLIRDELAPYMRPAGGRAIVSGAPLWLRPASAQAMALTIHELTTNAVKYGALSSAEGSLNVSWLMVDKGGRRMLELSWIERGDGTAAEPTNSGFGSILIRSSVERQLGGSVTFNWEATGLQCLISVPAEQLADTASGWRPEAQAALTEPSRDVSGCRVLVVEDEALIALHICDVLEDMGCEPLGPAATVKQAMELIRNGAPDAAILDVNLGGERSDKVAKALSSLDVPFLYCTGYADPFDASGELANIAHVSKPVDPAVLERCLRQII